MPRSSAHSPGWTSRCSRPSSWPTPLRQSRSGSQGPRRPCCSRPLDLGEGDLNEIAGGSWVCQRKAGTVELAYQGPGAPEPLIELQGKAVPRDRPDE
jgi:hypothetical protein